MRRTIFKYPLKVTDRQRVNLPHGAEIVHAGEQSGELQLWALVDAHVAAKPSREFVIVGTGNPAPDDATAENHVATVIAANGLVWHVFETTEVQF